MIVGMAMVFPLPVVAADPPVVWAQFPNGTRSSVDEFDVSNNFIVEMWGDGYVGPDDVFTYLAPNYGKAV